MRPRVPERRLEVVVASHSVFASRQASRQDDDSELSVRDPGMGGAELTNPFSRSHKCNNAKGRPNRLDE